MFFEYENVIQPIISEDQPVLADEPGIQTVIESGVVGGQNLLIVKSTLKVDFFSDMTMADSRIVYAQGYVLVKPSSSAQTAEDLQSTPIPLTIVLEEATSSPTSVS